MPVFKVTSQLAPGLPFDRRLRQWAKLIRTDADIDLSKQGGYAITGPFLKWGLAFGMDEGQFVVLASEAGSRAHRGYTYALVQCFGGQLTPIVEPVWSGVVQGASVFTAEQLAKAQNSELYSFACYAWLCFQAHRPAATLEQEARRQGLAELTAESDQLGLYDPAVARLGQKLHELQEEISDLKYELKTQPERLIRWLADGGCDEAVLATLGMEADVWRGDPAALARKFEEWETDEAVRYAESRQDR